MQEEKSENKGLTKGGKNLILLGVLSVVVAMLTTGVSLVIYHNSGDIYLDRSRPGFLPDEEEIEQEEEDGESEIYDFSQQGEITADGLGEYLEKLEIEVKGIEAYEKPFDLEILSDEHFGIPAAE